jgi:SHS2 domain-containing protein
LTEVIVAVVAPAMVVVAETQARPPGPAWRTAWSLVMSERWEHFAHAADMGVRGFGATEHGAFEQAALALTAVVTDPASVVAREPVAVECEAPDSELLFAEWLNRLIYEMATRRMLFGRFAVTIDGNRLAATAWGERVDVERHRPAVEVKGATYTALRVTREDDGWVAQTVVDV